MTLAAQEKASSYRDDEVQRATTDINLRHAQMQRSDASRELRLHEPNIPIESEVHVARAKAMLNIVDDSQHEPEHRVVGKTIPTRKEPPTFTKPLQNIRAKEGQAIKSVIVSCSQGRLSTGASWARARQQFGLGPTDVGLQYFGPLTYSIFIIRGSSLVSILSSFTNS